MDRPWFANQTFWQVFQAALFSPQQLEEAAEDVDALLLLTQLEAPAAVLDLCCGVGRHALELARRGMQVTAVDRTRSYLEQAQALSCAEELAIDWVEQDMREPLPGRRFELCINLYTSFGYFEDPSDDLRVAQHVHLALEPGGLFVLELVGKEVLARIFEEREWTELADGSFLLQERRILSDWQEIENRWVLLQRGQVHDYSSRYRLYSGAELRQLLLAAGFGRVDLFGDLEGTPYDNEARRLVAVARKS